MIQFRGFVTAATIVTITASCFFLKAQTAATYYINTYNPGQKICINDMALPIGGKFDIKDNWQSPHISHDQGTAADVAAVAGSCPAKYTVNLSNFRLACINRGNSLAANTITEGNHVHCRWAY